MKKFILFMILFIFILFLYAYYIDTSGVKVKEYSYESTSIPKGFDGFKIVHFSDLLYKNSKDVEHLEQIVQKINTLKPDIIVFTGDLLYNKIDDKNEKEMIKILKALKPELFKYAIKGDNDPVDVKEIFTESGFIFLDNESSYIFNEDVEPILIAGGDNITSDIYTKEENLDYNLAITLIHKPDDINNITFTATDNLVLAGHSLGGQIRLPFWGAVLKKSGAEKYTDDYYTSDNKALYVSYGIGTEKYPFRLFNKSSINVYRLKAK